MTKARAAVLHVNSSSYDSTSPTMRIARYAAERLGVPLIHDAASAARYAHTHFSVLLVKYGMLKFSNHREQSIAIHENAGHVINLENDYTFVPDSRFRRPDETWSTVEGKTHLVNWNILTRHPVEEWRNSRPLIEPSNEGLIYYGAHRPDRAPSFWRYFNNAKLPWTVSTYRGQKLFAQYRGVREVIGAFRDPDAQAQWQATVYIEDETSHGLYTSPATRFYECVMAGLAQFVDARARGTLLRAGIDVTDEYVVHGSRDLLSNRRHWRSIRDDQRVRWFKNYALELNRQFDRAVRNSVLGA